MRRVNETTLLGERQVRRLGFGAMQLPGPGVYGPPRDPDAARRVLKRAIEIGVQVIDTAWYYGPWVSNELIAETLHPYPSDLVIVTKLGGKRKEDKSWVPAITPEELRAGCENDLRSLKLDRIGVVHLRWIPAPGASFAEALDAMIALKAEGKIGHIGLSSVSLAQIEEARKKTPIACVSNMYNAALGEKRLGTVPHMMTEEQEVIVDRCAELGIAFLPWFSLAIPGPPRDKNAAIADVAKKRGVTESAVALAWLLARSPTMLPIPGTSSVAHLEENYAARTLALTADEIAAISSARGA